MELIKREEREGTRVSVYLDPNAYNESPREFENNGVMVLAHRRYDLPREGDLAVRIDEAFERGGLRLALRYLSVAHNAVVLPVYGYDHGELTLTAGERVYPFDDRWDSGVAGVIYAKRDVLAAEWTEHGGQAPTDDQIEAWLKDEVKTYDHWSRGELYGFVVEYLVTEHSDSGPCEYGRWAQTSSVWGYYSDDDAMVDGMIEAGLEMGNP